MGKQLNTLYLIKANDTGISHCKCQRAFVGVPAQMDCPWCGCGFLFICGKCGKAFTYARAEWVDGPLGPLVTAYLPKGFLKGEADVAAAADYMRGMTSEIEEGQTYVYIDGHIVPLDLERVEIEGEFATHRFEYLPHAKELTKPGALLDELGDSGYWHERAVGDGDGGEPGPGE